MTSTQATELDRIVKDLGKEAEKVQNTVDKVKIGPKAAAPAAQGFGSITDIATGKQIFANGNKQEVIVKVTADKEGIIKAVVDNPNFKTNVTQQVNTATKDAARATAR